MKRFNEGQTKQVLDTLFFDFIELAKKLKPKIVISENVTGILCGQAKVYVRKILKEFDNAGYFVREYVLDSSKMGVPQRRQRVFFIAIRKDLANVLPVENGVLFPSFPQLDMTFNEKPIPFKDIKCVNLNDAQWTNHDEYVWSSRKKGDRKYADVLERIESRHSNFNSVFIYDDRVVPTISASEASKLTLFDEPRRMNSTEMILSQSFPLDYNFNTNNVAKIQYVLGMSVPPLMMGKLVDRIYNEWKIIF